MRSSSIRHAFRVRSNATPLGLARKLNVQSANGSLLAKNKFASIAQASNGQTRRVAPSILPRPATNISSILANLTVICCTEQTCQADNSTKPWFSHLEDSPSFIFAYFHSLMLLADSLPHPLSRLLVEEYETCQGYHRS
jgi:hypothetical protein